MGYSITFIIGIVFLSFSVSYIRKAISFVNKSEKAVGVVTSVVKESDNDGGYTYRPIFTFQTGRNQEVTYRHTVTSSPASWKEGEEATIIYNPDNPKEARLYTYFGVFGTAVVLMAIAMPFLVIGGGYFLSGFVLR